MNCKGRQLSQIATLAADFGIPADLFQEAGAWLFGCHFCAFAAKVTRAYRKGKITRAEHAHFFKDVGEAKAAQDFKRLRFLKGKLAVLDR